MLSDLCWRGQLLLVTQLGGRQHHPHFTGYLMEAQRAEVGFNPGLTPSPEALLGSLPLPGPGPLVWRGAGPRAARRFINGRGRRD